MHAFVASRTDYCVSLLAGAPKKTTDKDKSIDKVKAKGQVLDIALLHDEHMLRSALQYRKWQLIGMS